MGERESNILIIDKERYGLIYRDIYQINKEKESKGERGIGI